MEIHGLHFFSSFFFKNVVTLSLILGFTLQFPCMAVDLVSSKKSSTIPASPSLQAVPLVTPTPQPTNEAREIHNLANDLLAGFFDLNHDGAVDEGDKRVASAAFTKVLFASFGLSAAQVGVFDGNQNGRIEFADLTNFTVMYLSPMDELAGLFRFMVDVQKNSLDYDRNGQVNLADKEHAQATLSLAEYFEIEQYQALHAFLDRNNDGLFTLTDETLFEQQIFAPFEEESRIARYKTGNFDRDADGDVDLIDLRGFVTDFKNYLTSGQDISFLDSDKDGDVDFDDRDITLDRVIRTTAPNIFQNVPVTNSDPLGLANGSSVLFVDSSNTNATTEANLGRAYYTEGQAWRQKALDPTKALKSFYLLNQSGDPSVLQKLKPGDRVYIAGDQSMLDQEVQIRTSLVTFRNYPGKDAVLRFGLTNSGIPVQVFSSYTQWRGLEFVGNVQTPAGRVFSGNLFTTWGSYTTIDSCTFRDNHGVPAGFLNNDNPNLVDTRFGLRKDRAGNVIPIEQQAWSNTIQFIRSHDSVIKNSTVQNRPSFEYAQISLYGHRVLASQKSVISGEGILIEDSRDVKLIANTITHFGHQAVQIRRSTRTLMENNNLSNVWNSAMSIYLSTDNIIQNNTIHDWAMVQRQLATGALYQPGNGIQIQGSSRNQIYGNTFFNATGVGAVISLGSDPNQGEPPSDNNDIFNNTISNVQTLAYNLGRKAGLYTSTTQASYENNNRFFNNLIHNARDNQGRVLMIRFQTTVGTTQPVGFGNQLFNNLLSSEGMSAAPVSLYINTLLTPLNTLALNNYVFAKNNLSSSVALSPGTAHQYVLGTGVTLLRRTDVDIFGRVLPTVNGNYSIGSYQS